MIDRPAEALLESQVAAPGSGRALLVDLYDAAVAGAAPGPLTAAALREFEVRRDQRLWLYAFGKAAHAMAGAAVATLQRSLHTIAAGVIVSPEGHPPPAATVASLVGDHPLHVVTGERRGDDRDGHVVAPFVADVKRVGGRMGR